MYLDLPEAPDEDQNKMSVMRRNLPGWAGRFLQGMPLYKSAQEETQTFTLPVRNAGDNCDPGYRIIAGRRANRAGNPIMQSMQRSGKLNGNWTRISRNNIHFRPGADRGAQEFATRKASSEGEAYLESNNMLKQNGQ
jgi:hypothetical protein